MFTIRVESPLDITAIRNVNKLAFNGENEAHLVDAIRDSAYFVPELSLVAVSDTDNAVIGHILFSKVDIATEQGTVPTLALAPMAVLPEHQNKGIGSTLVRAGVETCRDLGFNHVVVLGHPNFYPKFGFRPAREKGVSCPFPVPDEVFMMLELQPGALRGMRGTVKYPPAFNHVSRSD